MKEKLVISFSGGRTSAYMTWWMLNCWPEIVNYDVKIVFANTGLEDAGTLLFVRQCAIEWGIEIIWVEARHFDDDGDTFSDKGWQVKHQIVDYFTAARCVKLTTGEFAWTPFEEMLSVLGIPSSSAPFCSDQLKRKTIESYLKSIGWKKYYKAIGIRADEVDRMNENFRKLKIIYPLIRHNPADKKMVNDWWDEQPFHLKIDSDLGNCDACWKKDMKRLVRIAKKRPAKFDWWQAMTNKYGHIQTRIGNENMKPPFNFYRGNMSPADIFELKRMSEQQLSLFVEDEKLNSCSESCEAF